MITVNKANPTPGEVTSSLTGSTGDGAGLHFDGSAGALNFTPVDLGTKFSFEFVIKADSYDDPVIKIIDFGVSGNAGRFAFGTASATSYNLGIYDNSNWVSFGVKVLDDLKVHHLTLTVDGTAAVLYDNGNQVATATISAGHNIDATNDAAIAAFYAGSANFFEGTIYRARFYNRSLSSAEVQTAFERADVDFADQYGSQTELSSASFSNTGFAGYSGSATGFTATGSANGNKAYKNQTFTDGKKFRIKFTVTDGESSNLYFNFRTSSAGEGSNTGSIISSSKGVATTNALQVTQTGDYEVIVESLGSAASYRFVAAADVGAVNISAFSIVQIGAAVDMDLAAANPTQSLMVQDRSGAADGTCSASGVTQVQPVVQLNATAARVGTFAATPADGQILVDGGAKTAPGYSFGHTTATGMYSPGANQIRFSTASTDRLSISSSGNVSVNASGADAVRTLNVHGTNGSSELYTFAIEADGENAKTNFKVGVGGGAAATKLTIDSSGDVGVSQTDPQQKLHVSGGGIQIDGNITTPASGQEGLMLDHYNDGSRFWSRGTATARGSFSFIHLENDGGGQQTALNIDTDGLVKIGDSTNNHAWVATKSTAGYYSGIKLTRGAGTFADDANNNFGFIVTDAGLAAAKFTSPGADVTGRTDFLTIDSSGLSTFAQRIHGVGGISFGQTNSSATGAAATSTILDHYEEGTFTPTAWDNDTTQITTSIAVGRYVRIGRMCHVSLRLKRNDTMTGSSNVYFRGLPFSSQNVGTTNDTKNIGNGGCWLPSDTEHGMAYALPGSANFIFIDAKGADGGYITSADWGNTYNLYAAFTYEVA